MIIKTILSYVKAMALSLEMMLFPNVYYKRNGIRTPAHLSSPRLIPITRLELPRNSILHYTPQSETELGPSPENPLLKNVPRLTFVGHVTEYLSFKGNPRRLSIPLNPKIIAYRNKYRKLRLLGKIELADREQQNLIVMNYCLLPMTVRPVRSFYMQYFSWYNMRDTVIKTMVNLLGESKRDHYLVIDLPRVMPALNVLRRAESAITRETLKGFSDPSGLDLLDLFSFIGGEREKSLLNQIPYRDLSRVNFIFKRAGSWFVLNLGVLEEWRSLSENELQSDMVMDAKLKSGISGRELSIRFLKMISKLYDANSVSESGVEVDEALAEQTGQTPLMEDGDSHQETEAEKDRELEIEMRPMSKDELDDLELEFELEQSLISEEVDEAIDEDGNLIREVLSVDPADDVPAAIGIQGVVGSAPEDAILKKSEELASINGLLSAAEYRRLRSLAVAYKNIPNPYGGDGTLEDMLKIDLEDLVITEADQIVDMPEIIDKSMLHSTVERFDRQYVEKVMKKDIVSAVMAVQNANFAVTSYEVERVTDAVSDYERHVVQLSPVTGRPSTIVFRVPVVTPEGTFVSNGTVYQMRKQRVDLPIRKVSPIRVALTSDYGNKLFIETSSRSTFDYDKWLVSTIRNQDNTQSGTIQELRTSDVSDLTLKLPRIYTLFSENFVSFKSGGFFYYFDHKRRFTKGGFEQERVERVETGGMTVIGRKGQQLMAIDSDNTFYLIKADETVEVAGRVEDVLNLPLDRAPTPMAEMKLFSKVIPIGVVLSYLIGLDTLLAKTKATYRRVQTGERLHLDSSEFAVRFADESLIFRKDESVPAMLFNGFNLYHNSIRNYSVNSFNKKDIYLNVFESNGLTVRHMRELDLMAAMFIDPITKRILEWMNEPTNFVDLLLRAVELLAYRYVPETLDGGVEFIENLERIRGYERISASVYRELIKSLRIYNSRAAASTAAVTMNPHSVWIGIVGDGAAAPIEQTNPIRNLKEKEVVTFGGTGGRSRRSMVAETRTFKKPDIGLISETGVDSGDVGIITYVSPNAKLSSVYGTVKSKPDALTTPSSLLSSPALISPNIDRDDPKRAVFAGIQHAHGVSCLGARPQPISSGYDLAIAHRVDQMWANIAERDGEVISVSAGAIKVQYDDGSVASFEIGRQFGISAGSVYPSTLTTIFKQGDKISKGDVITFNEEFFEPYFLNPKQVVWKAGVLARTAFMEVGATHEDSSLIDIDLTKAMASYTTKVKTIVIPFYKEIRNLATVGESVSNDSILCIIEDPVSAETNIFDEHSIETLRLIEANTPRANIEGVVEKIEVFYHGDMEDMTESLQEVCYAGDRQRKRRARMLDLPEVTGSVDQSLRIEGEGLDLDHVAIKVYITTLHDQGVGDKAVFGLQLKTVVGQIMTGINQTADGKKLQAIFGFKSLQDRIVLSALINGMTNSLLKEISEQAASIYFEE